jgi:hypothetical protein
MTRSDRDKVSGTSAGFKKVIFRPNCSAILYPRPDAPHIKTCGIVVAVFNTTLVPAAFEETENHHDYHKHPCNDIKYEAPGSVAKRICKVFPVIKIPPIKDKEIRDYKAELVATGKKADRINNHENNHLTQWN